MNPRPFAVLAAAGLALALSGCSSDTAKTVESAAESAASAVESAASGAASAAESAAASAMASASAAASDAIESAESAMASAVDSKTYTMADVKAHSSDSDCWAAISGKVYDLTNWIAKHPGGADKITALCGTDATDAFAGQHGSQPEPNAELAQFVIGQLS